ncbi:fumarylacetoacetate hydrolase family protein [Rhodohalobacter halophilus]|uniref:fumarylacetoacetate hydrolase family protein n=1 Tax=Rhodohalobacter halophilus TaxID=1812810 RepID=UPI00083F5E60|nr:fumarylacetoacetate hydrolase family protein [Rhodohalobacter halophilus]
MTHHIPDFPELQFGSIYCIGRNYAKHAKELKNEVPSEPVVFLKPRSSLIFNGDSIKIPNSSKNVHHEVEMVILIGKTVKNISEQEALESIKAVGVGLDMTARDIQSQAKLKGLPWTLAKGLNTFAPLGNLIEYHPGIDLTDLNITVSVNGEVRQTGNTSDMLFPVVRLISYLSQHFTLTPGDMIYTGTPEGVSKVEKGDLIKASLGEGLSSLQVHVS